MIHRLSNAHDLCSDRGRLESHYGCWNGSNRVPGTVALAPAAIAPFIVLLSSRICGPFVVVVGNPAWPCRTRTVRTDPSQYATLIRPCSAGEPLAKYLF